MYKIFVFFLFKKFGFFSDTLCTLITDCGFDTNKDGQFLGLQFKPIELNIINRTGKGNAPKK